MKLFKIITALNILIIIGWIFYFFGFVKKSKEIVSIPDVTSLDEENARRLLDEKNLKYNVIYINGSKDICYTKPSASMPIYKDFVIELYISKVNEKKVSFLNLNYFECEDEIRSYCNDNGLSLNVLFVDDEGISGNIILEKRTDDCLNISVVAEKGLLKMPNLVGLNIYEALNIMSSFTLTIDLIYFDSLIKEDTVIFQSIDENTFISSKNQSVLELYISKGLNI